MNYEFYSIDGVNIDIYNISSTTESPYIRVNTKFYSEDIIKRRMTDSLKT